MRGVSGGYLVWSTGGRRHAGCPQQRLLNGQIVLHAEVRRLLAGCYRGEFAQIGDLQRGRLELDLPPVVRSFFVNVDRLYAGVGQMSASQMRDGAGAPGAV